MPISFQQWVNVEGAPRCCAADAPAATAPVGRGIVATRAPSEAAVLECIRELGLDWQIIFNKGVR